MRRILVLLLVFTLFGRSSAGEQATAVATLTAGIVTAISVTSGGSGYTSEPAVAITGGGGIGAMAKAILSGDKVALILVLTAGSGYMSAPSVAVQAPPMLLGVRLRLVPELTIEGPAGSQAQVESAAGLTGPWMTWTNVMVGAAGTVLVDLSPDSATRFYRAVADQRFVVPDWMVLIPAGPFQMGDDRVGATPVHTVVVSAFAMDKWEVSNELWESVRAWGNTRGYDLVAGDSSGVKHPVHTVNWYDVVKWNNARSEKEGKVPAYYLDGAMTRVYRSGDKEPSGVKWDAGYRLPTEAEWEKAARGGVAGKLYPWGTDEINTASANYNKLPFPQFPPFRPVITMPVGSYGANGYGLFDMAGNVFEWNWDWRGEYAQTAQTDPRGPISGSDRVFRGGSWVNDAEGCRVALRVNGNPGYGYELLGFRSVLPLGQQ